MQELNLLSWALGTGMLDSLMVKRMKAWNGWEGEAVVISSLKIFKQPSEENLCLRYEEGLWRGHSNVTSFVGINFSW